MPGRSTRACSAIAALPSWPWSEALALSARYTTSQLCSDIHTSLTSSAPHPHHLCTPISMSLLSKQPLCINRCVLLTDSTDIWQNMSRGNSPHCSGCIESTSSMHHLSCKLIFVVTLKRCLCLCLGSLFSPIKHSSTRCRGCDRGDKQIYKFAGSYMYASVQHVL